MALFTKLPNWASILIIVIAAIVVVGLVSWGGYELFKPAPPEETGGEGTEQEEEKLPEEEDEFVDWKTYRNEEYGFEAKYPKEADVILSPKGGDLVYVGFNRFDAYEGTRGEVKYEIALGVYIKILENPKNLLADKWYAEYYAIEKDKAEKVNAPLFLSESGESTRLNDHATYKTRDFAVDHQSINFYISHKRYIYRLVYSDESANDPKWTDHVKIINQILSTFKFIEPEISANWKTYINEEYEFEIKYPEDWGIQTVNSLTGADDSKGKKIILWSKQNYKDFIPVLGTEGLKEGIYNFIIQYQDTKRSSYIADPEIKLLSSEQIIIDNISGTKDKFGGSYGDWTVIYLDKGVIVYSLTLPDKNEEQKEIANQILSTFKFLD